MGGLRPALGVVSLGTALVAAWLTFVLVAVVPGRSPASLPAWLAVDILAIALLAAGLAWLARPGAATAAATRVLGIAAAVVGALLAASWIGTPAGADSDGYVLLIGGWLLVHGLVAVAAPGLPRDSARPAS
jgi:uncharacterized membrane protein HdeD (DUF308 family)